MSKLSKIRLKDCQSWEDQTLDISGGLNVIIASNSTGKSVLFKMLRATCQGDNMDKKDMQALIRRGSDFAEITYVFDDNSIGVTRVFPTGMLHYYAEDIEGGFNQYSGHAPQGLIDKLGIVQTPDGSHIISIVDDEQPRLLVHTDSSTTFEVLKVITEHPTLKRLLNDFTEKYSNYRTKLSQIKVKEAKFKRELDNLEYVDESKLESQIDTGELLLSNFEELYSIVELSTEITQVSNKEIPIDLIEGVSELFVDLENLIEGINLDVKDINSCFVKTAELFSNIPLEFHNTLDEELGNQFENLFIIHQLADNIEEDKSIDLNLLEETSNIMIDSVKAIKDIRNLFISNEEIENNIKELEAIKFEGKEYECPLYGKVKFINNKCEAI